MATISEEQYFEDRMGGLSRRELLALTAAAGVGLAFPRAATAAPIVKPVPPEWFIPLGTNAEMRWEAAAPLGYTIPASRFFVRNHTSTPVIDPATWRLTVFGSGLREPAGHVFSLRSLRKLEAETVTAFIECAGNGRRFFASQQGTPVSGSQWGLGAIGVARWRGVPLRTVLERAGITQASGRRAAGGARRRATRPGPRAPAAAGGEGARRRAAGLRDERRAAAARSRRAGAAGRPRLDRRGVHQVARPHRGVRPAALLALEHHPVHAGRPGLPGGRAAAEPPGGQERVRAAIRRHAEGRSAPRADGALLVGPRDHPRASRCRPTPAAPTAAPSSTAPTCPAPGCAGGFRSRPRARAGASCVARATDDHGRRQPDSVPFNTGGYLFWAVVRHPVTIAG